MSIIVHKYSEMIGNELGIYRRIDAGSGNAKFYINEGGRPRTAQEYVDDSYIEGDDVYYSDSEDEENAPRVSYEKIDELSNIAKYLPEPMSSMLSEPFEDEFGVVYANGGKTLVRAPKDLDGDYECKNGVEVIFRNAFADCESLVAVTMPETLKVIGKSAFSNCSQLVEAELPDSIEILSDFIFNECKSLEESKIPSKIIEVPYGMYYGCKTLKRVFLHNGIEEINSDSFEGTDLLFELELPKSLTHLGDGYCSMRYLGLTSIVIPGSVKKIQSGFYSCDNLCAIIFEEGVEEIGNICGECPKLGFVVLPSTMKKVGSDIFRDSSPNIYIPEGTTAHFREILPERLHQGIHEGAMSAEEIETMRLTIEDLKEAAINKFEEERDCLDDLLSL